MRESSDTKRKASTRRLLWANITSLYGVQAAAYLVPMFTLPFLTRVLGRGEWGVLAFAEACSAYGATVIEFGFGLSATREIARSRLDRDAMGTEVSGVLGAQLILTIILLASCVCLGPLVPMFRNRPLLIVGAALLAIGRGMTPMWFFQGVENIRPQALLNIAANVVGAASIFVFVKSASDSWMPLALRGSAALLASLLGIHLAYRWCLFKPPSLREGIGELKDGLAIFSVKAAVGLYTFANIIILGFFVTPAVVAVFAGTQKILNAGMSVLGPLTQAIYPRLNHLLETDSVGALKMVRRSAAATIALSTAGGLIGFFSAPLLVKFLLGDGFEQAVPVLRVMCLLPPLISANTTLGMQWMLALRMDRQLNMIVFSAGLLNVILALTLAKTFPYEGMPFSVLCAEGLSLGLSLLALRRRSLNPVSARSPLEP